MGKEILHVDLPLLAKSLDGIMDQQMWLVFWVVEHADACGKLKMTLKQIIDETGFDTKTINRTFKEFCNPPNEAKPLLLKAEDDEPGFCLNPEILERRKRKSVKHESAKK